MTPLDKVLDATRSLGPQEPQSDGSFMVVCPAHEDANPSLHVSADHSGKIALNCFKGCHHRAICYAMGMTVSELFPDHGQRSDNSGRPARKKSKARDQIRGKKKVAEFDYRDADGILVYQAVRYEDDAGKKTFIQRRPNGQGGYVLNMNGVSRVLYRLPELIAAPKDQIVYILEGERKTETVRKWGLIATCNVGGAGKWLKEYSKYLRGRRVIILPDNDPVDPQTGACPGMDHARKIIASLEGETDWVRVLILPGLPPKGDIDDWVAEGGNLPKFLELVKRLEDGNDGDSDSNANSAPFDGTAPLKNRLASDYQSQSLKALDKQPDPAAVATLISSSVEESLLASIRLEVLGEIEGSGGKVKVFSEDHRKTDIISDVGKLSYERLLQVCGPAVKKSVHQGQDDVPGVFTLKDVRQAIAVVSGFRRVGNETEVGRGIWRGKNDNLEPCNSIVLVGAGEAARWNGDGVFHRVTKPRSDGLLLDFGNPTRWYEHDALNRFIQQSSDIAWTQSVYNKAHEIFDRWEWKNSISPHLVVCLVMATFVQTIWAWRPQVIVIGETNAGKSMLFEVLSKIFGKIAHKSSASSPAGIRQSISNSGEIVLCDEIDSNKDRQAIFDMIRLGSRGDSTLKGTPGHKNKEFTLRHIVWLAGIESGIEQEPDRNRFVMLELIPPPVERMGQLKVPSDVELAELGQQLLAIAIRHGIKAVDMAGELKREQFESCNQRVVESYASIAAMNVSACGESPDQPGAYGTRRQVLEMLLNLAEDSKTFEQDKDRLLAFIFSSVIEIGHGQKETVARAIKRRLLSSDYPEALERNGIKISSDGTAVFLAHNEIKRKLLKHSDWEKKNIGEILERIDGAEKKPLRIAGVLHKGFLIPSNHVAINGDEEE